MPDKRGVTVQSVERAIAILNSFSVDEPELGVGQLSRHLGLAKSTVFRLLSALEAGGLVAQNPESGRYRLGVGLVGLASNVIAYADLRRVGRFHLQYLANTLQETVSLSILDGSETVNVEQFAPPGRLVREVGWVGRRMPSHTVSVGKAILAFLPEEELACLDGHLEALTPHTITDPQAFRAELAEVQEQGYATAFEELEEGLHAVAAPIYNHEDHVVAAVSVSGPSYRLTRERIREVAPQVVDAALQISRELGYRSRA
ncbi:MAG: IclR family transcriptional regulator [Ardenticatenaceae bacterium]|nr:IclR family transcriptional regulator [Ardenticatenaceae bacterium]HBY98957.1 IclR family transcriptional regulator [Chloroflexota bacterium]